MISKQCLRRDQLNRAFRLDVFRGIVAKRRGAVKSLLLSQEIIAGMGNLYVDETLYRASIHPRRAVDTLSDVEVKAIFTCMRAILKEAIAFKSRGGDYPGRWLTQHRE